MTVAPGDVIVAVNGASARGRPSDEVKALIMGKEGTPVELLIRKVSFAPCLCHQLIVPRCVHPFPTMLCQVRAMQC